MAENDPTKVTGASAPLSTRLMAGGAWMVATRWALRLLGLVNVAVLARLLNPHDFGLVAMAMAFVAIADAIMNFGAESAVIQMGEEGRRYYNSAWTMRMAQNLGLATVIAVLALVAPAYYNEPRVEGILLIVALGVAIRAFENIGVTALQQDLQFASTFWQQVISQLVSIAVAVTIAVVFRSYWALVLGSLARTLATVVLSFALFPYRPRIDFSGWRRIWSFSQWYLVTNLGKTLLWQGLPLTLGRAAGPAALGIYTLSAELAATAAFEIAMPISRVLYTGMVRLRDDRERYRRALLQALHAVALITTPICLGLAATSREVVLLALGDDWVSSIPIMQLLTITGALRVIALVINDQLVVLGQLKRSAVISWVQAIILLAAAIPVYQGFGLMGVACVSVGLAALTLLYVTVMMAQIGVASIIEQVTSYAGSFVAAAVMAAVVMALPLAIHLPVPLMLALKVIVGALVYGGLSLLFWQMAGRPDGFERKIVNQLSRIWAVVARRNNRP